MIIAASHPSRSFTERAATPSSYRNTKRVFNIYIYIYIYIVGSNPTSAAECGPEIHFHTMSARYDYATAQKTPERNVLDEVDFQLPRSADGESLTVFEAMKEELRQVKEALHIAMQEAGADALESRYLAQIRKNKNLTVQLSSERTKAIALEKALQEAQQRTRDVEAELAKKVKKGAKRGEDGGPPLEMKDIVMDIATRGAKERMGYDAPTLAAAAKGKPRAGESDSDEELEDRIKKLKERLNRSFKIVAERDALVNEAKRETQLWRKVVMRETGASKEDLDRLLSDAVQQTEAKSIATAAAKAKAKSVAAYAAATLGDTPLSEDAGTPPPTREDPQDGPAAELAVPKDGWRGRAQTIVLLRGKLKDAEEALRRAQQREAELQEALAAAKSYHYGDGGSSTRASQAAAPPPRWIDDGAGGDDLASLMALAQRQAPAVGPSGGSASDSRSPSPRSAPKEGKTTAGGTEAGAVCVKDVDDGARQHLAQLGNKRLQRQRELEAAVQQREERLQEEQRRHTALKARFAALQRDHHQLRQHVETLLQKSQSDDDLIEAYKGELVALQHDLREARESRVENQQAEQQRAEADAHMTTNLSGNALLDQKRRNILGAERRRARELAAGDSGGGGGAGARAAAAHCGGVPESAEDRRAHETAQQRSFFAHLQEVLDNAPGKGTDPAGAAPPGSRQLLEDLLSASFRYVKALEATASRRDAATTRVLVAGSEAADEALAAENKELKKRLATLSELLEKSEAARRVWAAAGGPGPADSAGAAAGGPGPADLQARFNQMKKDYDDMKREYNRLQMQSMKRSPI
eukprot:gene509-279_t